MIAAVVWGGLLGLLAVGLLLTVMYIGTPERQAAPGRHQRPTRRQRERAADEAYLRQLEEVRAEQHMEAGPVTASGMALPGPLMPLPPEEGSVYRAEVGVTEDISATCHHPEGYYDFDPWAEDDVPEGGTVHMYQLADGQIVPADSYVPPEPDDLAAATPEQEAGAYAGDPGPAGLPTPVGAPEPTSNTGAVSAEPEPLFDRDADHWREDTLLGMPAVK